jgi:hypothetical protein
MTGPFTPPIPDAELIDLVRAYLGSGELTISG